MRGALEGDSLERERWTTIRVGCMVVLTSRSMGDVQQLRCCCCSSVDVGRTRVPVPVHEEPMPEAGRAEMR